jgi:hypothetical protein
VEFVLRCLSMYSQSRRRLYEKTRDIRSMLGIIIII